MPFELFHFRESEEIIKQKNMTEDVQVTLSYIDLALYGFLYKGPLLRQALEEMGWRGNGPISILEGRRYQYKGLKKGVAIEGSFSAYEYVLEGLLRLQVGYDKGVIETGVLLLNGQRSEKTPYGSTAELVRSEVADLYPTISMPVSIALFDLGTPDHYLQDGEGDPTRWRTHPDDYEFDRREEDPRQDEKVEP